MKRLPLLILVAIAADSGFCQGADKPMPVDSRDTVRTLNDKDFNFTPPQSKEEWAQRRQHIREQILVATGLWPLPEKTPLNAVIHGKIERDGYTIEKVFFASYPGHYVCGNLYRPKGQSGKRPAILNPHGHWANGRFHDASEKTAQDEILHHGETTINGGRYPSQAIPAQLAKMGCVVFHYDMLGYADSFPIGHREGFTDVQAELRLQNAMGLQTWNSIRALDFLASLPDVDPDRLGVTGHSGGGTQTFILCAVDDRPAVAFPAVMVGTAMQGGCICENCSYLRQRTGNVEFAALFAPKPLGMTGANDWTVDIEKKGLPELKELYKLLGAEDMVMAKCFPQFGHNYNQISRELMYNWFNKHLRLGLPEPVREQPFEPVNPKELSVFDEAHPRPKDALDAQGLRKYLTEQSDKKILGLMPKASSDPKELRRVVGTALDVMIGGGVPQAGLIERSILEEPKENSIERMTALALTNKSTHESVKVHEMPSPAPIEAVILVHPHGRAGFIADKSLDPQSIVRKLSDRKADLLIVSPFHSGPNAQQEYPPVNKEFAGYTFGYNSPLAADRVRDILTVIAYARGKPGIKKVYLVGFGDAGPLCLLAKAVAGDAINKAAIDVNRFRFDQVTKTSDPMMLPGAVKYGGLPAIAALCASGSILLHNSQGTDLEAWVKPAYESAGASKNAALDAEKWQSKAILDWLFKD